jgi:predicted transposase YdaD
MAQTFDVTFKLLFRRSQGVFTRMLFGEVTEWPNVEQPTVRNQRPDLLARSADGTLRHVEIQASNDPTIPLRMLDYYVGFHRLFGEHVQQTLLYVGRDPIRIATRLPPPAPGASTPF